MAETNGDSELQAIQTILSALGELDSPARSRVIDYVFRRLWAALVGIAAGTRHVNALTAMPRQTDSS